MLKYNECVYILNIINQGEGFYKTDIILGEINYNLESYKNICASNTIICTPKTKITNKENYNNLKIKTNNIGKKNSLNNLNNLNNNTKRLLKIMNKRNF